MSGLTMDGKPVFKSTRNVTSAELVYLRQIVATCI